MYRFVGRMAPEDLGAITAQAYVEMLEGGFTRVGEFHYIHRDPRGVHYNNIAELGERIAEAAQTTGIGLTLLPVFYAHGGFSGQAPAPEQHRFINTLEQFGRLIEASRVAVAKQDEAVVGVAPHSLRAVTLEQLLALLPLAAGGPIHIHVAEQTKEVEDCVAWSGRQPVEWLLDNAPVDRRWCLIHATHMTAHESRCLAATGAVVGLCPITEANLGDGIFDAPPFLEAGGSFGVGSDSNVLIDAAAELRQLEYSQRLARRTRNVIGADAQSTGRALFNRTLAGGSQALGFAGGLARGNAADIISLDAGNSAFAGRSGDALLDSWIFGATRSPVDCVWTRGRKVVTSGKHHDGQLIGQTAGRTACRMNNGEIDPIPTRCSQSNK
jgi:formiminoglutamate deiminase